MSALTSVRFNVAFVKGFLVSECYFDFQVGRFWVKILEVHLNYWVSWRVFWFLSLIMNLQIINPESQSTHFHGSVLTLTPLTPAKAHEWWHLLPCSNMTILSEFYTTTVIRFWVYGLDRVCVRIMYCMHCHFSPVYHWKHSEMQSDCLWSSFMLGSLTQQIANTNAINLKKEQWISFVRGKHGLNSDVNSLLHLQQQHFCALLEVSVN